MHLCRVGVDDIDKGRLEGSTTDEETINVLLLGELVAVLLADGSTVDDARLLSSLLADLLGHPLTQSGVHLLGLLGGGDLAGANGPDGLVCDDNLAPVLDLVGDGLELGSDDLDGLAGLALLEGLAAAENDAEATVNGRLGLGGDKAVALLEDDTALAVAEEGPGDVGVLELLHGDLAGEGSVGSVEDVLCCDLDAGAEVLTGEKEVEERWCNDNLCGGLLVSFCGWASSRRATYRCWSQALRH